MNKLLIVFKNGVQLEVDATSFEKSEPDGLFPFSGSRDFIWTHRVDSERKLRFLDTSEVVAVVAINTTKESSSGEETTGAAGAGALVPDVGPGPAGEPGSQGDR